MIKPLIIYIPQIEVRSMKLMHQKASKKERIGQIMMN